MGEVFKSVFTTGKGTKNSRAAADRLTGDFNGEVGLEGTMFLRISAAFGEDEAIVRVNEDALIAWLINSGRSAIGMFGTGVASGWSYSTSTGEHRVVERRTDTDLDPVLKL